MTNGNRLDAALTRADAHGDAAGLVDDQGEAAGVGRPLGDDRLLALLGRCRPDESLDRKALELLQHRRTRDFHKRTGWMYCGRPL